MAAGQRRLKKGLSQRPRTVILMLDETILCATPPLYSCYGRIGEQVGVPISGSHDRRVLHGVMNIASGEVLLLITENWDQQTHQGFLRMIRSHWRGWHIVLFEDRGSPHTAQDSRQLARQLGIQIRLLPRATAELNALDHLWRHVKRQALANRPTLSLNQSADAACLYILHLRPKDRLRKAGILSGNFWLTT